MNMMSTKAMDRQPKNFTGLLTSAMEIEGVILHRSFKCVCGNRYVRILAGEWANCDAWLDPVSFECVECGAAKEIFNSQTDGYDGILCGGASCMQNSQSEKVQCSSCSGDAFALNASLFYNIDFDDPRELDELTGTQKAELSDLYDALSLAGTCKACGTETHIGNWELA